MRADYARSQDPEVGLRLATLLLEAEKYEDARWLARRLTSTSVSPDAQAVLAKSAHFLSDGDTAKAAYAEALRGYQALGDSKQSARMAYGLAAMLQQSGDVRAAQRLLDEAITGATGSDDQTILVRSHLAAAEILRDRNLLDEAERELDKAKASIDKLPPESRAKEDLWYRFKVGTLFGDRGYAVVARRLLSKALETSELQRNQLVQHGALLNLAWVEQQDGAIDAALRYLARAEEAKADALDIFFVRGQALLKGGSPAQLIRAAAELRLAQAEGPQGEWSWSVPYYRGLAAERLGKLDEAAAAYQKAVQAVEVLTERNGRYSAELVASHRRPYWRLIGLHAARGQWEEVLRQVMQLDGLSLIASEARPLLERFGESPAHDQQGALLPELPPLDYVLKTWRQRHLLIFVSDELTMWRLEISGGRVQGEAIGVAAELEALAQQIETNPTLENQAARLGELMLQGLAPLPAEVIEVLSIGPISRVPLALLRLGGQWAIERMLLARQLSVLPRARLLSKKREGAVVLGDPKGDLIYARQEAQEVATLLGVAARLGEQATRAALADAKGKALLHIAAHSELRDDGRSVLELADGEVVREEIAELWPMAKVVVLASCKSAAARDEAGLGSLARAFLDAGAEAVIATLRDVDDEWSRQLVLELFAGGVQAQPVQALARAQRAAIAAGREARDWGYFTVLLAPP